MSGGLNSNFRLNIAPTPVVFERGEGPHLHGIEGNRLIDYYLGMREIFAQGFPQVFHIAFGLDTPATDYRDLARMNPPAYVAFTTTLLRRGVRALERGTWFLSIEHTDAVIEQTLKAIEDRRASTQN
jgi:glutamate-1-semialdehyde 2,1-aminomutase